MKNYSIYYLLVAIILSSCNERKTNSKLKSLKVEKEAIQLTKKQVNSEGVFLFTSEEAQIISWTEQGKDKNENYLKCAFFDNTNNRFNKPIIVSPSLGLQLHSESMAKVAITKQGVLYAVFRIKSKNSKSRYGGAIYYATSINRGQSWSEKQKLVLDPTSTSQSFFDIAQLADGELGLSWLDNRKLHKDKPGQTLYFAKTGVSNVFNHETPLEGSVCQCCRTDIEVAENGNIKVAFRNLISPEESGFPTTLVDKKTEIRDMYFTSSTDNGMSFSKSEPIYTDNWQVNGCPHTGPSLASNSNESAAVWFTDAESNSGIFFKTNTTKNKKIISKTGSHPQMVAVNGNYFIVYEEYYEVENKGYTKIVLQEWDAKSLLKTAEISTPKTTNDHAVINILNTNQLLISWVNTDTRNSVVQYLVYSL